jgi:hypothetical protein
MAKKSEIKAVFLEWDDSHHLKDGWQPVAALEDNCSPFLCQSVGFVVRETRDHITIVAHIGVDAAGRIEAGIGNMTIPKKIIIRRQAIKFPKISGS